MSTHEPSPGAGDQPVFRWLEEQSATLDADTLDRINAARRRALDAAAASAGRRTAPWLAGAAMAGLAALLFWPVGQQSPAPPAPVPMETFRMLASPGELELLESLDFYLWLEADPLATLEEGGHAG